MGQLFQLFVCKEDTRGRGQGSGFCRERERKKKRDEEVRRGESRSQRGSATQTKRCLFVSKRSWRARRCRLRTPSHPHTQRTGTLPHKDLPFTSTHTHTHIQIVLQTSQCLHYIGVGWRKGEGGDVHKKCVCVRATLIHL